MRHLIMHLTGAVCAVTLATGSAAAAGTCYSKNDKRDKWLAEWVYWIPKSGTKAEARGKSYSQSQAIKWAKQDIPKSFKKRGSDVNDSAAGLSALMMIEARNNAAKAERKYNRKIKKTEGSDGKLIKTSFADASACWTRYK